MCENCFERKRNECDSTRLKELKTKRNVFKSLLCQNRFREYYSLVVDLAGEKNFLVAVDTDLREVVIPRNKFELSIFVNRLGPEYAVVCKNKIDLCREIIK